MGLRRSTPLTFNPAGLSDALDGTTVFPGAMGSLANLIPDPSTSKLWQCRPAALQVVDFSTVGRPFSSGFSSGFQLSTLLSPLQVSCMKIIGNIAFGLIGTAGNPNDTPFAYNLATNVLLTVSGITAANTPITQPLTGAWTPPTMDLVGTNLLVTHPGFTGAGGVYFGWFDITNPNAITWSGGNLTGAITFTTVPTAVKNFNGRAYWAVNPPTGQPSLVFSDVLVPRNATNANQALTFDDNVPLTALGALPLANQVVGGIVQSLIVFKGVAAMFQVTGDAATSNLAKNALNIATGTLAPNTIQPTPKGLAFIAPDGLRIIGFDANVSDPIGADGFGKTLPFLYSVVPSRMYAAANGSVYRVTVQDGTLNGSPFVEYWFDWTKGAQDRKGVWSGPHTFPARCIAPYNSTFIVAPLNADGKLFQSDYVQSSTSTFTENGTPLTFSYVTSMLPDTNQMAENAMVETTVYMALAPGGSYTAFALDQNDAVLGSAILTNPNQATVWGNFQWGQAVWGGAANNLYPQQLAWTAPVVFRRTKILVQGNSALSVRVGTLHLRYEQLGYLQQPAVAA